MLYLQYPFNTDGDVHKIRMISDDVALFGIKFNSIYAAIDRLGVTMSDIDFLNVADKSSPTAFDLLFWVFN